VPGGFASFAPATGQPSFRITNVALETPTLPQALAEVRRGPLGPHIQEVKDFVVGDQPASWVTFAPDAEFQFVVLVIAPDCGDGAHALFISAAGADEKAFETFLNYLRFIQEGRKTLSITLECGFHPESAHCLLTPRYRLLHSCYTALHG
jgi:hypothetical protein